MIPLWMFPVAFACGNASIIKPSERDPGMGQQRGLETLGTLIYVCATAGAVMLLMKLAQEAGFPDGSVNVIHGSVDGVEVWGAPAAPLAIE
jgi:malonate-semialdehyde dehydrogenase (acetylating)/methylmalonate-semialdehyde dehydrogenase